MLNFLGSLVYLLAAASAALAAWRVPAWRRHWIALAALFCGFAAWRLGAGEALVQDMLRESARAAGSYGARRSAQGPVVALLLMAGLAGGWWLLRRPHGPPAIQGSRLAGLGLLAYTAVRLVSFHPVDAVIYRGIGPLHVNHLIDMGLTGVVLLCALAALAGKGLGDAPGAGRHPKWRH